MALSPIQLTTTTTTLLLLVFLLLTIYIQSTAADSADSATPLGPSAMVLPLTLSAPNSSRTLSHSRRHLQRSESHSTATARMPLYDDLIPYGYYTTRIWIGTPPQTFALIVDTGSTLTYVPCSTCEQCGKHQDPNFQPDWSSTYQPLKCSMECTCDSEMMHCVYDRQYAEMSSSSGVLGEDIVSFGKQSELKPQRTVFGCENVETGDIYSQRADGIMGLGRGDLSIVDQLVEKGVIGMVFTHSDPARSAYYNIDLKEIHIAGKQLPINPMVFDGKYGTILDSGTTYAYLPEPAFKAFKDAIMKELNSLKLIQGPDRNYNDICFSGVGSDVSQLSKTFPAVDLVFSNGNRLSLSPENYLFQHSKAHGAYCLGIFQNENDQTTLLGGIIVRNTLVIPPPALPSASPPLAPSGPQFYTMPEDLIVGFITFEMILSIMPPKLKPHLTKLAAFVAHGLEVDTSQVHLLNITSEYGHSVITWAIYPAGSGDYISHAAARNILAGIAEHRVSLPPMFGNYQVFDWSIEPPAERTWWQQHHLAVVMTIFITILLGLLASGMWFVWRRRWHSFGSYKPVNYVFPEHELQPL
ncbi:Aspartic proteinase-like protein 2 [Vitis vinifera]|uniref:Aspartic proteinase-like protein 2 n=1 Tax=Vitis vinifera TaxID=29760 RepID=A0A438KQN2_VITVI|nr:Aspartic proteinase-like protein 2 [Vitis vinifera]